jgi:hypothetical protein
MSPRKTQPPTQRLPVAAAPAKTPVLVSKLRIENVMAGPRDILLVFIMTICLNAIHHDK